MADSKVRFTFEVTNADGSSRTLDLAQEMVKIGKHPSSHILIDDEGVSRMHAYVEASASGEVVIMDLGSATGTFVNGEKVTKKRPLMSGDLVKVGGASIKVWLDGATGASAGTAAPTAANQAPKAAAKPAAAAAAPAAKPAAAASSAAKPAAAAAAKPAAAAPAANPFAAPAANPFAPIAAPVAAKPAAAANPFAARPQAALGDPFAAPSSAARAPAFSHDDDGGDAYYAMVAAAPPVPASEVETNVPAIEVMVMWGERDILHVSHLSPPRPFVLGEGSEKLAKGEIAPDFRMESEFLGMDKMTIASPEGNGVAVIVPQGATITVRQGQDLRGDDALRNGGELRASNVLPGALQYQLREGEIARVKFKGFVFQVKAVQSGLVLGNKLRPDPTPFFYVGGVMAFFVTLFLVVSFLDPPGATFGLSEGNGDPNYVMAQIAAAEQRQPDPVPSNASEAEGGSGQAAAGDTGEAGEPNTERTNRRQAVAGDAAPEDQVLGRNSSNEEAAQNNVVTNAVASIAAMFSAGPTSAFGADQAIGGDPMSAIGGLIGAEIGSSGGNGGLGLIGSGAGGGGTGAGTYGLGNGIGTLGQGGGGGGGAGYGHGGGGLGDRAAVVPRARLGGSAAVQGGLTADQIRRVIQRNISQVQHCYEQGLQRNPSLAGRVTVAFMITPSGSVGGSSVADNSLGDAAVGTCVAGAVRRWAFPQPDPAGPVSVRFPFNLTQSGG